MKAVKDVAVSPTMRQRFSGVSIWPRSLRADNVRRARSPHAHPVPDAVAGLSRQAAFVPAWLVDARFVDAAAAVDAMRRETLRKYFLR